MAECVDLKAQFGASERLYAFTTGRGIGRRLRALPFVEQSQGDVEVRVVFHVDHLAEVLAILKPYRRRQALSDAQKAALAVGRSRLSALRGWTTAANPALESTQTDRDRETGTPTPVDALRGDKPPLAAVAVKAVPEGDGR